MIYPALILLKIFLDISYISIITKEYSHLDYNLNFNIYQYLSSWILFSSSFLIVKSKFLYIRDYFISTSIIFLIAPISTIYGLDYNKNSIPLIYSLISLNIISFSGFFSKYFNKIKYPNIGSIKSNWHVSIALMLFLVIWYKISGAEMNLDISRVYEYRIINREITDIGILAYLNGWIFKVFSVFSLSYCLFKKKYFSAFIILFVFIYFFSINAHKAVLLTPILIISTWFVFSKTNKFSTITLGICLLISISFITYYVFNNLWLAAIFIDRLFLVPANLTFIYFDFFQNHQFIYFSNSFLSSFIDYPYTLDLHKLIGEYKGHYENESANNGYISSAYAQGGFLVILIYSVTISIFLLIIDSFIYRKEIDRLFTLLITLIPLRDLISSADLLTTLLTGGLFISILLIFLSKVELKSKGSLSKPPLRP